MWEPRSLNNRTKNWPIFCQEYMNEGQPINDPFEPPYGANLEMEMELEAETLIATQTIAFINAADGVGVSNEGVDSDLPCLNQDDVEKILLPLEKLPMEKTPVEDPFVKEPPVQEPPQYIQETIAGIPHDLSDKDIVYNLEDSYDIVQPETPDAALSPDSILSPDTPSTSCLTGPPTTLETSSSIYIDSKDSSRLTEAMQPASLLHDYEATPASSTEANVPRPLSMIMIESGSDNYEAQQWTPDSWDKDVPKCISDNSPDLSLISTESELIKYKKHLGQIAESPFSDKASSPRFLPDKSFERRMKTNPSNFLRAEEFECATQSASPDLQAKKISTQISTQSWRSFSTESWRSFMSNEENEEEEKEEEGEEEGEEEAVKKTIPQKGVEHLTPEMMKMLDKDWGEEEEKNGGTEESQFDFSEKMEQSQLMTSQEISQRTRDQGMKEAADEWMMDIMPINGKEVKWNPKCTSTPVKNTLMEQPEDEFVWDSMISDKDFCSVHRKLEF